MVYGTGCIRSKLDGTERKFQANGRLQTPDEYTWIGSMPPVLDQGSTSKCVCYSLTSVLDWKVNRFKGTNESNNFDIDLLYSIRKRKDLEGMEIKEALKYLRKYGLGGATISSYAMLGSPEQMKQALIMYGPFVGGLPVYRGAERGQFWKGPQRNLAGGHCVTFVGYNPDGLVLRNSWGTGWADRGYILFPWTDFSEIFEAWTAV